MSSTTQANSPADAPTAAPAVRMIGIGKAFDGVTVLDDVNFEVAAGEVHALAGGNGAGKSTLMKILLGVYSKDAGSIELNGQPLHASSIHDAQRAGIGMVFQEFSLIPTMTVAQNIYLDAEPTRGGIIDDRAMKSGARELLARMGVAIDPSTEVGDLPTAEWQLTEIAKALSQDAKVLVMDEPTASLSKTEVDSLFELIDRLRAQGISIVYISHRMEEVYRIADRITILRNGKNLLTSRLSDISEQEIVDGIAGRELTPMAAKEHTETDQLPVILDVQDLRGPGVHGASFQLRAGEVVGIAGLMGSGRTELARILFGMAPTSGGTISKDGKKLSIGKPQEAIDAGIALIPEDRRLQGLVLDHSVRENLTLPLLRELRNGPFLSNGKIRTEASELIEKFSIKVARPGAPARLLSGGNQQKIVIAKWLGTNPDVLIMDEPTAGVDVGTKSEIVSIVRGLARSGKGVLVISSEFAELIAMCDRYLVMRRGEITGNLTAQQVTSEVDLEFAAQGLAS